MSGPISGTCLGTRMLDKFILRIDWRMVAKLVLGLDRLNVAYCCA